MASRRLILPLLGSIIATGSGFQDLEPLPETYCVTYLSTYLLPLSAVTTDPVARESSSSPSSNFEDLPETFDASLSASTQVNTSQEIYDSAKPSQVFVSESGSLSSVTAIEDETITTPILQFTPTATSASTTGAPGVPPGGRAVLFRVTVDDQEDTRGIQKRDIGGFVGTQTDDCNAANTFRLVEGQLIDNDAPIFYAGEYFKPLRGQQGAVPEGAITKTFASQGGILTFTNSDLPNGGANFCQDPNDGQVYITFTSAPANCVPVRLAVVDVELCDQEGIVESTTLESQSLPISTESSIPSTASSGVSQNPETTADASKPTPAAPTSRLQTTFDFIPPPIVPTSRLQTSSLRFFNTSTFSNHPAASTEQVEPTFISLETSSTLIHILPDPSTSEGQSLSSEAITQPEDTTIVPPLPTDMLSTQTLSTNIPVESDDTSTIVIESTTAIAVSESETETLSIGTTTIASSEASLADTATISVTATSSDMEIDSTTTTGVVVTSEATTSSDDATITADTATTETTTTTEDDTTSEDATTTDDTTTTDATSTTTADTTSGEDTTANTESDIPTTTEEPTTTTDALTTTTEAETTTTTAAPTCESVLANPTPVSQSKIAEDGYDYLQPEFNVGLFEDTYQNLFISPFGILSLTNGNGLDLSNQDIPTSQVDPLAIFAYWDNMEPRDSEYDITYEYVTGGGFGRLLIFNYCVYTNAASTKPNHFTITFYEDCQSFIRVNYYQTENQGGSASIGVQNNDVGKFLKQSFNQAVISDRTEIDFDTRDGQEYIDTRSF
ncbi:hypothetical protein ACHAQD_010928 [Fusarium lateritium]